MNMLKLKGLIVAAGYNQRTFAPTINMTVNTLNSRLNEKSPFNTDEIEAICDRLHITVPADKVDIFFSA